ncbi:MAG: glycine--tRNA ligase [Cytophagales bacterium]|nr:glycine--tRNA ligase [Cytophagales bacterium]
MKFNYQVELKNIIAHAREYGFVFQSSEIYDGLQAVYDYGQYGVELKNNINALWWQTMTRVHENIVGIDSAIFMHPRIWKASGHIDSFNDPMIDNKDSKKRYSVEALLQEKVEEYQNEKSSTGNKKAQELLEKMNQLLKKEDLKGLLHLIISENITCPVSGTCKWTDVRQFNLMFSTQVGSLADETDTIYLRPETAQGIFVNFLNVQKTGRLKIPFGIAQIGKAFRNEIVARQFIFRMREFEQMEMQYLVKPGEEMKWYKYWKEARMKWYGLLGIAEEKLRFHEHEKLAHYANAAVDIEYEFPFGFKEIEGIHSRTDFDLKNHQQFSGKKMQYFDNEINKNYLPYVVETSTGTDRILLMLLCNGFTEEQEADKGSIKSGEQKMRTYLKLPLALAPVKAAIFPLVRKDGLPEKAKEVVNKLKYDHYIIYEERDSIGRRYTRQDLIGTPFCITVDHETLNNDTVTIRHRDTMEQNRLHIEQLNDFIRKETSMTNILEQISPIPTPRC